MSTKRRSIIIISVVFAALLAVLLFFAHPRSNENENETVDVFMESELPNEPDNACAVPILMYHHLDPTESGAATVTVAMFEAQIASLSEAGYTAVTLRDLVNYVDGGSPLPEKPIVITFDDGYLSNYEYALPILEKYGMCATVFAIGYSFGCDTYKDTGVPIIPHFGVDEARAMVSSGVFDIQSHTYDMHGSESIEGDGVRVSVLPLDGESPADYEAALRQDIRRSKELLEGVTGKEVFALAYPRGHYNQSAEEILTDEGIRVTLTTEEGMNAIIAGDPKSLLGLKRYSVDEGITPDILLSKIGN